MIVRCDGKDCVIRIVLVVYGTVSNKERRVGKVYSGGREEYHRMDDIVQNGEVTNSSMTFKVLVNRNFCLTIFRH